jgi:hypothetical protein
LELETAQTQANALQQNVNELELLIRTKDEEMQQMQQKLDVYPGRIFLFEFFLSLFLFKNFFF